MRDPGQWNPTETSLQELTVIEMPVGTQCSSLNITGFYWTFSTKDMQTCFFRDWGTYWNDVREDNDQAQQILNALPEH